LAYLLALVSAAIYGAADFLGGLAARRAQTSIVVVVSGVVGLVLLAALMPLMPGGTPSPRDLVFGVAAGLGGAGGIGFLYRALAIGRMAVVAPTTALCAVAIPAVTAMALGERPSLLTLAGIALALVAIVLVSQARDPEVPGSRVLVPGSRVLVPGSRVLVPGSRVPGPGSPIPHPGNRGIGLAFLSGVSIGFFYLALAETSPEAGLWPLVTTRTTSATLFTIVALVGRHSWRMPAPVLKTIVACGALDMTANALYLVASRRGPLSVIVTLSSLYPASTVILARVVLGERLSALQIIGVVCALVAVVLIVGGR
jgi:drug/metabolite transporter (DMT)-like permease